MTKPCKCGPSECIHPSRLLPGWHCKVAEASRALLLALVEQLKALPKYQEHDVVRRPSTIEYFDAEQTEEVLGNIVLLIPLRR